MSPSVAEARSQHAVVLTERRHARAPRLALSARFSRCLSVVGRTCSFGVALPSPLAALAPPPEASPLPKRHTAGHLRLSPLSLN